MTLEDIVRSIVREELARRDTEPTSAFLSVAEAAAFARVSPGTVRRWIKANELTRHSAGTRVLVDRAELEAFLRCEVVPIDAKLGPEERARRRFG